VGMTAGLLIALLGSSMMRGSSNSGSQQQQVLAPSVLLTSTSDPQGNGSSAGASHAYNFENVDDKDPSNNEASSVFDFSGPDGSDEEERHDETTTVAAMSTKSATKDDGVSAETTPSSNVYCSVVFSSYQYCPRQSTSAPRGLQRLALPTHMRPSRHELHPVHDRSVSF